MLLEKKITQKDKINAEIKNFLCFKFLFFLFDIKRFAHNNFIFKINCNNNKTIIKAIKIK